MRLFVGDDGSLEATGDLFEPFRLIDACGVVVAPAAAFFRELAACGGPAVTHRSGLPLKVHCLLGRWIWGGMMSAPFLIEEGMPEDV